MIKSCYIHIPFCETICSYCDFCKQFYDSKKVKHYLENLKKEIENIYQYDELNTIYIGGGTPTCLKKEELEDLFQLTDKLKKSKDLEFTVEGNFESITKEKLRIMKEHGVNRLSLGIESIDEDNLKFLDRTLNKEEVVEKIHWMRELGFSNINLDLIYAIPKESLKTLEKDLEFITSLEVEHISTYSLMIEENTKLKIQKTEPISEDRDEEMYRFIRTYLEKRGYHHYEISNFAKEGMESSHNKCYWHNEEYYGFGLGASSYIENVRSTNTKSLKGYEKGIKIEEEVLEEKDKIEYEIILNLRLREGINLNHFQEKYKKEFKEFYSYEELVKEGLLQEEENHIWIPNEKWYVSNQIIGKLLENKIEL